MDTISTSTVEYPADGLAMVGQGPGLDDVQLSRADAPAEPGYVPLAVDIHGGRWLGDPEEMLAR